MSSNLDQARKRFERSSNEAYSVNSEMSVLLNQSDHDESVNLFTDQTPEGPAVRCFLSPFDALLDGLGMVRHKRPVDLFAALVTDVTPEAFLSSPGLQRPLSFHVAWLAHDRQLIAQENGGLMRLALPQGTRPRGDGDRQRLHIDPDVWTAIDALHWQAGLVAWRDTHKTMQQWFDAAASAQDSRDRASCLHHHPPLIRLAADEAKQMALYDPEAARWHFVPRRMFA